MSRTRSVSWVTNAQTSPTVPAGMIAAAALTRPSVELRVEARGCGCPQGYIVRNPSVPWGTTVTLRENAWAVAGMPQELLAITNPRVELAPRNGPPKSPFGFRVSAIRQGVAGTKRSSAAGACWADALSCETARNRPAVQTSRRSRRDFVDRLTEGFGIKVADS